MADEVFTIGYKIDSSGVEGEAEAAGKAAAEGFQKGFGSVTLTPKYAEGGKAGEAHAKAFQEAAAKLAPRPAPTTAAPAGGGDAAAAQAAPQPAQGGVSGTKVALQSLSTFRTGVEGLVSLLAGSDFATGVHNLQEFTTSLGKTAELLEKRGRQGGGVLPVGAGARRADAGARRAPRAGAAEVAAGGEAAAPEEGGAALADGGAIAAQGGAALAEGGGIAGIAGAVAKFAPQVTAAVLTIGAVTAGVYELTKRAGEDRRDLEAQSRAAGLSTEDTLRFRGAARGAGIDPDELPRLLAGLARRLQGAQAAIDRTVAAEPLDKAEAEARVAAAGRQQQLAPLVAADAQDNAASTRVSATVIRATAAARDEIARQRGPLNVESAVLGLDAAEQTRQQHENEGPEREIAARAAAAVAAATAAAREKLTTAKVDFASESADFSEKAASIAAAEHAVEGPLRVAGARLGVQEALDAQQIGQVQAPETVKGAEAARQGAYASAHEAGIRLRQARGEDVDPEEIRQAKFADIAAAARIANVNAEQADINVEKAKINEAEEPARDAHRVAEARAALQRAKDDEDLRPEQDKLKEDQAALQKRAAELDKKEEETRRTAGETAQLAVKQAFENLAKVQQDNALQAHQDALQVRGALIAVKEARAQQEGQAAAEKAGGGAAGGLTPQQQAEAADRKAKEAEIAAKGAAAGPAAADIEAERAKQVLDFQPPTQISQIAKALKGEQVPGLDLKSIDPGLMFPALTLAGKGQDKDPVLSVIKAWADVQQRFRDTPGMQGFLNTLAGQVTGGLRGGIVAQQDLMDLLGRTGAKGVDELRKKPLSPDDKRFADPETLKAAEELNKAILNVQSQLKQPGRKLLETPAVPAGIEGGAGVIGGVVGALTPTQTGVGAAALTGAVGYIAHRLFQRLRGPAQPASPEAPPEGLPPEGPAPVETQPFKPKVIRDPKTGRFMRAPAEAPAEAPVVEAPTAAPAAAGPGIAAGAVGFSGAFSLLQGLISGTQAVKALLDRQIASEGPLTPADINKMKASAAPAPEAPAEAPKVEGEAARFIAATPTAPAGERAPGPVAAAPASAPGPEAGALTGAASALNTAAGSLASAAGSLSSPDGALSSAASALQSAAGALQGAASALSAAGGSKGGGGDVTAIEKAQGGLISGSGDDTSDRVPIWASPFEYIIKASRVRALGTPFLDRINSGYAMGGLVKGYQGGGSITADISKILDGKREPDDIPGEGMRSYTPIWSERVRNFLGDTMRGAGTSKGYAEQFAGKGADLAQKLPIVGNILGENQAFRDLGEGRVLKGLYEAVSNFPGVPGPRGAAINLLKREAGFQQGGLVDGDPSDADNRVDMGTQNRPRSIPAEDYLTSLDDFGRPLKKGYRVPSLEDYGDNPLGQSYGSVKTPLEDQSQAELRITAQETLDRRRAGPHGIYPPGTRFKVSRGEDGIPRIRTFLPSGEGEFVPVIPWGWEQGKGRGAGAGEGGGGGGATVFKGGPDDPTSGSFSQEEHKRSGAIGWERTSRRDIRINFDKGSGGAAPPELPEVAVKPVQPKPPAKTFPAEGSQVPPSIKELQDKILGLRPGQIEPDAPFDPRAPLSVEEMKKGVTQPPLTLPAPHPHFPSLLTPQDRLPELSGMGWSGTEPGILVDVAPDPTPTRAVVSVPSAPAMDKLREAMVRAQPSPTPPAPAASPQTPPTPQATTVSPLEKLRDAMTRAQTRPARPTTPTPPAPPIPPPRPTPAHHVPSLAAAGEGAGKGAGHGAGEGRGRGRGRGGGEGSGRGPGHGPGEGPGHGPGRGGGPGGLGGGAGGGGGGHGGGEHIHHHVRQLRRLLEQQPPEPNHGLLNANRPVGRQLQDYTYTYAEGGLVGQPERMTEEDVRTVWGRDAEGRPVGPPEMTVEDVRAAWGRLSPRLRKQLIEQRKLKGLKPPFESKGEPPPELEGSGTEPELKAPGSPLKSLKSFVPGLFKDMGFAGRLLGKTELALPLMLLDPTPAYGESKVDPARAAKREADAWAKHFEIEKREGRNPPEERADRSLPPEDQTDFFSAHSTGNPLMVLLGHVARAGKSQARTELTRLYNGEPSTTAAEPLRSLLRSYYENEPVTPAAPLPARPVTRPSPFGLLGDTDVLKQARTAPPEAAAPPPARPVTRRSPFGLLSDTDALRGARAAPPEAEPPVAPDAPQPVPGAAPDAGPYDPQERSPGGFQYKTTHVPGTVARGIEYWEKAPRAAAAPSEAAPDGPSSGGFQYKTTHVPGNVARGIEYWEKTPGKVPEAAPAPAGTSDDHFTKERVFPPAIARASVPAHERAHAPGHRVPHHVPSHHAHHVQPHHAHHPRRVAEDDGLLAGFDRPIRRADLPETLAGFDRPSRHSGHSGHSRRSDDVDMWDPNRPVYAMGGLIPAMTSNGEYRMGASAVRRLGVGFMHMLNGGGLAAGGIPGVPAGAANISPGSTALTGWSGSKYASDMAHFEATGAQQASRVTPSSTALTGWSAHAYDVQMAGLARTARPPPAPGGAALSGWSEQNYSRQFASGGLVGGASSDDIARLTDYGGGNINASLPPVLPTGNPKGSAQHVLDLATPGGVFQVHASTDTLEAIRVSAIGAKLTSAGTKPSWY